jgi:hypothetical protein
MLRACCSMFSAIPTTDQGVDTNALYLRINDIYAQYQEADVAIVSYLSLLCRIFLLSPITFFSTCHDIATELSQQSLIDMSYHFIFKSFFLLLIQKFDGIGYHRGGVWHRRVCCYALLSLYPTSDEEILRMLPEVLYVVDDVLSENRTREGQKKFKQFHENYLSLDDSHDDDGDQDDDEGETATGEDGSQGEVEGSSPSSYVKKKLTINYLFGELLQSDPILAGVGDGGDGLHQFFTLKFQEISQQIPKEELEMRILPDMDRNVLMRILMNDYEAVEPSP